MKYWYFIIPALLLLLVLILLIIFHFRKRAVIRKVKALSPTEKATLLNHLGEPLGYLYDPVQDIWGTRLDAPQKLFGYNTFYDLTAAYFNMVFDYETIYFDYAGRTWLIEMWKGQYGINSGCELGIYYADSIVSPEEYSTTHFQAVEEKDMLDISLKLNRHNPKSHHPSGKCGYRRHKHWWLTIFKMGSFSKPEDLFVNTSIRFKDYHMLNHFLGSFEATLPNTIYKVNGLTVYFTFCRSNRSYSFFKKFVRNLALWSCRIHCKWFNTLTKAFSSSGDKILYLYYYLPIVIRLMFKPKKAKHRR
ncbi:MAG: DUF4474 domain-containing protein [Lachnospiraceae bacterium]|nr:DUF4474 domain-containing protein [Lachnospiraceae bacterium]